MVKIPLFTGFYTSQVVQDFFHQQYHPATAGWWLNQPTLLKNMRKSNWIIFPQKSGYQIKAVSNHHPDSIKGGFFGDQSYFAQGRIPSNHGTVHAISNTQPSLVVYQKPGYISTNYITQLGKYGGLFAIYLKLSWSYPLSLPPKNDAHAQYWKHTSPTSSTSAVTSLRPQGPDTSCDTWRWRRS